MGQPKPKQQSSKLQKAPTSDNQQQGEVAGLLRILEFEVDIRRVESLRELHYHMANESREMLGFRQAFVFRSRGGPHLVAISSVASFDKNAPLNRSITRLARRLSKLQGDDVVAIDLGRENDETLREHAFGCGLWMPLIQDKERPYGGLLLIRERAWDDSFLPLAERVREAYAFAWRALTAPVRPRRSIVNRSTLAVFLLACMGLMAFVKAPLTVLAPSEVTGQDRVVVAAPIDGAIDEISVAPNQFVQAGTLLVRLDDTELKNSLEIAERSLIVAQAALEKLQSASFTDRTAARDLKVAEAELALAQSERDLTRARLDRVDIVAPKSGVAVFDDPRELTGRPIVVGERIMDVIDPDSPEFTIRLPVDDSIVIEDGGRVRVFLDADPLRPIEATIIRSSYHARMQDDGSFGYTMIANPDETTTELRIGTQGTAQIYGAEQSILFIVFRRPLSWLRQTFGY